MQNHRATTEGNLPKATRYINMTDKSSNPKDIKKAKVRASYSNLLATSFGFVWIRIVQNPKMMLEAVNIPVKYSASTLKSTMSMPYSATILITRRRIKGVYEIIYESIFILLS